jgi:hypothetical protein
VIFVSLWISAISSVVSPPPAACIDQLRDAGGPVAGIPLGRDEVRIAGVTGGVVGGDDDAARRVEQVGS